MCTGLALWINAEDISPSWGAYGIPEATTPNLDKLAAFTGWA